MKILNADRHKYIPQQHIKYGNGFFKGEAFYLPEYKGDGIKEVINTAAGVVGTIADVVSRGAKVVKSSTGSGIEADALNNILDTRIQVPETNVKTGSGYYFVNSGK